MSWYTEYCIPLIMVSGLLLIFKDGLAMTLALWIIYLLEGLQTVKRIPSEKNKAEFGGQVVLAVIVNMVVIILKIAAHC